MLTDAAVAEFVDLADKAIKEITVVAHHDERTVEIQKRLLQHILRLQVEMVGRLIENQQVHRLQQQLEDGKTGALATRQHLHLLGRILAAT